MLRIGIDIGGTNIVVGLIDEDNTIVGKAWTPTRADSGFETIIDDIAACINNALTFSGFDMSDCSAIGIGTPGTCDTENAVAMHVHHLGLEIAPYGEFLKKKTGLDVYIENDANCAALGEVIAGAAQNCSSALMVTLRTGVGGGFIVDGKVFGGYKSLGGEFGHTCIAVDGVRCACGEIGCWDAYASGAALVMQASEAAEINPDSLLNSFDVINGEAVFEAAKKGDETANAVLERYFAYVGVGVVNMINSIYPEVIIIGGGVSAAGDMLLNGIRSYVERHFFVKSPELMPRIVMAELGNDAGIIGAAALCIKN